MVDDNASKQQSPHVVCLHDRRVRAWPPKDGGDVTRVRRMPLAEALGSRWPSDAHATGYDAHEPYRLRGALLDDAEAAKLMAAQMVVLWSDLDDEVAHAEEKPARPEWREEVAPKLYDLNEAHPGLYTYTTRGGCRVVYTIAPRAILTPEDALAWRGYYLRCALYVSRRFGLAPDPRCGDWTRLYRLPCVLRDGVRQTPDDSGDANVIGIWTYEPTDEDLATDVEEARRLAATSPAWESAARFLSPPSRSPRTSAPGVARLADLPEWHAEQKQRHPGLLSFGARLHRAGLTGGPLLDALRAVNRDRCVPPLDDEEITPIAEWLDARTGATPGGSEGEGGKGPKQAEVVIRVVTENAELFHDEKETAYAIVQTSRAVRQAAPEGDASTLTGAAERHGPRRVLRLRSPKMRSWIARTVRNELGSCVGSNAIDEALVALDGIAQFDRDERKVHIRVAEREGAIYIDLGDDTGACVEATSAGWRVRDEAPVAFWRPDAMRPLPRPERGGRLDELRAFFNAADDDAFYLFVAWLVAAYRPDRPFPILALHGEQGTAKSTASRVARALVDPNASPVRSAPQREDDLAVAAAHSHVIAFDNLSGVKPWLSDSLCRLATGGGLSKRKLYTDEDETVLEAIRPVIVNGIDDLANRADLAERCLVLELRPIPKARRVDERQFWRVFNASAPRILGVLLDGVASALRELPRVHLDELPRMADFALFVAAAEPGLGLPRGTLLAAYERNRASVVDVALDASPVATAVRKLLDRPVQAGRWEGEPAQLLAALREFAPDETRRAYEWPKTARALSSALRRAATFLRTVGVAVDLEGREGHDWRRAWRLTLVGTPATSSAPSASSATAARKQEGADANADGVPTRTVGMGHADANGSGDDANGRHDGRQGCPQETGLADGADGADGLAAPSDDESLNDWLRSEGITEKEQQP